MSAAPSHLPRVAAPPALIISPYELAPPSLGTLAALMLAGDAQGIATLLPAPSELAPGATALAPEDSPRLLRLMEHWSWSAPLWRSGLLRSSASGARVLDAVMDACAQIGQDERYADLRPLVGPHLSAGGAAALEALAGDLLRGGGNPTFSVPIGAGLEALAARTGAVLVRDAPRAAAARGHGALGAGLRFSLPVLKTKSLAALSALRDLARPELEALRAALGAGLSGAACDPPARGGTPIALREAGDRFAQAFGKILPRVIEAADREGEPARAAEATLIESRVPFGSALGAAVRAVRSLRGEPSAPGRAKGGSTGAGTAGVGADRASSASGATALARASAVVWTIKPAPWDAAPGTDGASRAGSAAG